jgi:hypothetical protein
MANAPQPPVRISLDIVGAVRRGARNTGRWPVRPAGILPAVVQASISGVKLRWAHRLESLCSVNGRFRRGRVKKTAVRSVQFCRREGGATLLHQQHRTAAFDLARDLPVHVRRHACDSPRQNFPALGHELFQQIGILVIDCFRRDIDAAARHGAIGASKGGAAFGGLWLHEISGSRGEAYAFSKTDCIFSFPTGSECAGSSCFASTYNAKPVCPKP